MNQYRALANDLRRQGASAARAQENSTPLLPFSVRLIAVAIGCSVLFGIVIVAATITFLYPGAAGHLMSGRFAALDRFTVAGVDPLMVNPTELSAFISTRPEDRRALIELDRYWPPPAQRTMLELMHHSLNPSATFSEMTRLAYVLKGSPGRQKLAFAIVEVDEEAAARLVSEVNATAVLKEITAAPVASMQRCLRQDQTSRTEITARSDPQFAARAGSTSRSRAGSVSAPAATNNMQKAPSEDRCAAACAATSPAPCILKNAHCPSGFYPTIASIQCMPIPNGDRDGK